MADILHHMIADAPAPVAPYAHAVEVGGWLFVTGQLPIDPENDKAPLPRGVAAQTHRVFKNLTIVLKAAGATLADVVAARVFLTDFYRDYERMNRVYATYFPAGRRPARTCVGVNGLARRALVEIDFIARKPKARANKRSRRRAPSRRRR
jgi:reactive intermediate/imine deaminase